MALADWLASEHLEPDALKAHAESFANDSHRMVVIDGALRPEVADAAARYLSGLTASWAPEYGLFQESDIAEERFEKASESDRFYSYDVMVHPTPDDAEPSAATVGGLLKLVTDPTFRAPFETIHGGPLGEAEPATVHRMGPNAYLKPHNDRSDRRRLAAVLYLNPNWAPEHGGAFRMFGASGARRVEALFNRLLIFDVEEHYGHNVEVVSADAPGPRLSIGWWLADPAG